MKSRSSSSPRTASGAMLPADMPGMAACSLSRGGAVAASGSSIVTCWRKSTPSGPPCWAAALRANSSSTTFLDSAPPGRTVGAIMSTLEMVDMGPRGGFFMVGAICSESGASTVAASSLVSTSCMLSMRSSRSASGRASGSLEAS